MTNSKLTAPKRAMAGLKMAISDCIEMSSDFSREEVKELDSDLTSQGIVTLTELRRQYSLKYARITKRGVIKTLEEYYLMKGVLDGTVWEMDSTEQAFLTQMLVTFEEKTNPGT